VIAEHQNVRLLLCRGISLLALLFEINKNPAFAQSSERVMKSYTNLTFGGQAFKTFFWHWRACVWTSLFRVAKSTFFQWSNLVHKRAQSWNIGPKKANHFSKFISSYKVVSTHG